MDVIKELCDMKDTIAQEIADANQRIRKNGGALDTGDVEIIDKLTHSMKSLATTVAMLEAQEDGGYSGRYMPTGPYYPGTTYGYSGRDGHGYSRNGGGYSRNDGRYSRNGYSRTGDMSEHLRQMMDDAPDEMTRMEIKKLIDRMDNQR